MLNCVSVFSFALLLTCAKNTSPFMKREGINRLLLAERAFSLLFCGKEALCYAGAQFSSQPDSEAEAKLEALGKELAAL